MVEEMDALDKNEAWNLVKLPAGRKFDACLKISLMQKVKWRSTKPTW